MSIAGAVLWRLRTWFGAHVAPYPPFFSWTGAGTHDDDEPSEIEQRELEIRILMLTWM